MATTTSFTLGDLIDETIAHLYSKVEEFPRTVTVGSTALASETDNQITLATGAELVNPTDVLETPSGELLLVTSKSSDATPVFTVQRGYLSTEKGTAGTGDVLVLSPTWPRQAVRRAVLAAFDGPMNAFIPALRTVAVYPPDDVVYVPMPADCIEVKQVRYMDPETGRIIDIHGWTFEDNVPTPVVSSGKLLRVPSYISPDDQIWVTYHQPYTWSDDPPTETSTVEVPAGSHDIPVLFAAAYMASGREISRLDLDRVEEWNEELAVRQGISIRLVRELWANFYRRLDEARRVHHVPRYRPYRKMRVR